MRIIYYYHHLISLKNIHKRLGLYKVLTHSQGNLEAKGEPRATNTGQIKYRKNLLPGWTGTTGHPETGQAPHLVAKPGEAT